MSFEGKVALVTGASLVSDVPSRKRWRHAVQSGGYCHQRKRAEAISAYLGDKGKGLLLNVTDAASIESVLESSRRWRS